MQTQISDNKKSSKNIKKKVVTWPWMLSDVALSDRTSDSKSHHRGGVGTNLFCGVIIIAKTEYILVEYTQGSGRLVAKRPML